MTRRSRRPRSAALKAKVAVAAKARLLEGAAGVFGGGGPSEAAPVVDVKVLHAKIGELTLENDFLSGALGKAGLLSARR